MRQSRKLFVNIAVRDLERSKKFFGDLGFTFNPQFTNHEAACMEVSSEAWFMLLTEKRFKDFTLNAISDTSKGTEALYALSCDSRQEVDDIVRKAIAAGGSPAMDPMDHGFMYGWSFKDPDGHHFEVLWMDLAAAPPHPPQA